MFKIIRDPVEAAPRPITGPWDEGWALARYELNDPFHGYNEFWTPLGIRRTPVGELIEQVRSGSGAVEVETLAQAFSEHVYPRFGDVDLIAPASTITGSRVTGCEEVAKSIARRHGAELFDSMNTHAHAVKRNVLVIADVFAPDGGLRLACHVARTSLNASRLYLGALAWK